MPKKSTGRTSKASTKSTSMGNKGGAVRGKDRAAQVKARNQVRKTKRG